MKHMILTLLSALLLGCSRREKLPDPVWESTPGGHRVEWRDQGTTSTGRLTKPEVFALFDKAVQNAVIYLSKYGTSPQQVTATAKGLGFYLIDNKNFPVSGSPTGFASGQLTGNVIYISLYSRVEVAARSDVPSDAPSWTIATNGQRWSYGVLSGQDPFPALGHEIGHVLYGPTFEH